MKKIYSSRFPKHFLWGSLAAIFFTGASCTTHPHRLQDGAWRAELTVADGRQAPFLFDVRHAATDSAVLTLINGEERVPLAGIHYVADTVIIPVAAYDAEIQARVSGDSLDGRFIRKYVENDPGIPFKAQRGDVPRFAPPPSPATVTIDGTWDVLFVSEKRDTVRNVGVFSTYNHIVTGSILTNSGDLRFLEGTVTGTGVQLSAFGGLSPYLIDIDFTGNDTFEGTLYTARGKTAFVGRRNDRAALADVYALTKLKRGFDRLGFSLPDAEGRLVSLNDARYKGKVVIVSVLGTWCPNCLDEAEYLAQWYKENKDRGVEIIGLAFERKDDAAYAYAAINRLKAQYGVDYEILFAGKVGGAAVAKVLPEIDKLSGYPTTFFIDRKGNVAKIHTGFSGPATGAFYEAWKKEFNALIDELLSVKNIKNL
ncbi:MAG: TlpA family protein disulfide reductase [Prevotellaceae bacterium]|jgi:thiol-disulfide isomerase/thioredoxin|nr:TlpA family protein disulfide reductase [Prevotellaceae bacterium]